jgi:cob(I)alamin adenosyltransferase
MCITGNGKGKTTAALGCCVRALGHDKKVAIIQFIKHDVENYGEYKCLTKLGCTWKSFGEGFTWNQETLDPSRVKCQEGWQFFKQCVESGEYDLIVLDELTYTFKYDLLNEESALSYLKEKKKDSNFPMLIITGRGASDGLIDVSDTVSSIENVKHHYKTLGQSAKEMIEF